MTTKIKEEDMVSVPKQVLQDLIWNCELAVAGMGVGEEYVGRQCRELQRYIQAEYPIVDETEFTFDEYENVAFVDFRKRV
jgi:hypothetical protein